MKKLRIIIYTFVVLSTTVFPQSPAVSKLKQSTSTLNTSSNSAETIGLVNCNNLKLPFNNKGVIADVDVGMGAGAMFDNRLFLFTAGFFLSGIENNEVWANGSLSGARLQDYLPSSSKGIIGITDSDEPFKTGWVNWKNAVADGAYFYDGDGDGVYNPRDLNGNGEWDTNEDRPDILGSVNYFCSFTDSVPSNKRLFSDVSEVGVTIRQTIFAVRGNSGLKHNAVFIRYSIINNGNVAEKLDSVYFSAALDADIGNYTDDRVGSDTIRNAGYFYQPDADEIYGSNPPCFYIDILQGPATYIPGVTFIDNNNDGSYTQSIDTPLETAYSHLGPVLGKRSYPGARNLRVTAATESIPGSFLQYPTTKEILRNYQIGGKDSRGISISACSLPLGTVRGNTPCANINPCYFYSGDPVSNVGWLNTVPIDQRLFISSGPFSLDRTTPVDIIVAYIIGRGTNGINSIKKAREMDDYIQQVYNNNFSTLTAIDNVEFAAGQRTFTLEQNYPNPFNPTTTISYSLPHTSKVTITVFDALGREVAVLVNGEVNSGRHEVLFNAANLSSGIYFYTLKSAEQTISRKLIVLK